VLRAPTAGEEPVAIAVVADPARPAQDVRREDPGTEGGGGPPDPVEPAEGPERLPVAVPFLVVLLVLAPEETEGRARADPLRPEVERTQVVGPELALGQPAVPRQCARDGLDRGVPYPE
jgi:hypothetical protein